MCSRYNGLNKHFTKYTVYKIKERYQFEDVSFIIVNVLSSIEVMPSHPLLALSFVPV